MIYVVLGMHKSGTTLISEILHHSGIRMVEGEEDDYDTGTKYERADVFRLNNGILGSDNVESLDIRTPSAAELEAVVARGESANLRAVVGEAGSRHDDWGMKDPRLCLTYPLWREVLPEHRIIGVYRSPFAVATRYGTRRSVRRAYRVIASWHEHNIRMLSYLRNPAVPWVLFSYERLMLNGSELDRLSRFIGRPAADRRRPDLRRSDPARGATIRIAEALYRLRTGRTVRDTLDQLDRAAAATPPSRTPPNS